MREIDQQSDVIQLRPLQRDLHPVIMPVGILALALVAAQGVTRRKRIFNTYLKHSLLSLPLLPWGRCFQAGLAAERNRETSSRSLVLRYRGSDSKKILP